MSSPNYDHLAHLKIPLESILSATNNFDEENSIGEAVFVNHYKGQLLWSGELIDIHAQRWSNNEWDDEKEQQFWMEISLLSSLKHKNLASLVGFCDENGEKIIIIKRETYGRLDNYLSDTMILTWLRRLEICVGVAHALSHIHYDESRDFSVINQNIKSGTVLINDDYEPKLSEFRLSMKITASQRHHSFHVDKVWDREGYTDPTYLETKSVSNKSDIYSFGILLFEVLCGRKSKIDDQDNKYLVPMAIFHYREKLLHDIIDPDLLKQMDPRSLYVFAQTAYDCLSEERSQRPNINEIVSRLEIALKLQMERQNVEQLIVAAEVEDTSSNHDKGSLTSISTYVESHSHKDLSRLKLSLQDIRSATNNFAAENIIEKFKLGTIYKGRLLHSKQLIDIIVKKFFLDSEKGESKRFWTELLMLSSLKHKNLVSIIGFCDENGEKAIITRREIKGSLNNYLSDLMLLTWVRRLEICVGIANALSYIHYDESRDFSVIHQCICSGTVLLNDDWEPKLSGFEVSMKIEVSKRYHSFHSETNHYTYGYGDPTCIETQSVNHKSDIYSFGIVLFELLYGRKAVIDDERDNQYLAPLAITHYREKKLREIIDWDIWKQMNSQSFKIFAETAYDCLKEEQSQRPNIDEIVRRLEKALKLQLEHQKAVRRLFLFHLGIIISTTIYLFERIPFILSIYTLARPYKTDYTKWWPFDIIAGPRFV